MNLEWLRVTVVALDHFFLAYFLLVNGFYTTLLLMSRPELWEVVFFTSDADNKRLYHTRVLPGVTMVVPAFNEEATIRNAVEAMLNLKYPTLEVIVINDGSQDNTLQVLKDAFDLFEMPPVVRRQLPFAEVRGLYQSATHPFLTVLDKENGGKADALNAGLCLARTPLVCCLDGDTLIEPDALLKMVRPYMTKSHVIAVGGTIRIANGSVVKEGRVVKPGLVARPLVAIQVVEYLRAFMFGRLGLNRLGGNMVISGAFGLFDRKVMVAAGGYAHGTVGEDMEVVVRLHRYAREQKMPYRVDFVPDPVAWTEAPATLRQLGRQRDRWHRGLFQTVLKHKVMFFNPRYGMAGLVGFPYIVLIELMAPLVEMFGYVGFTVGLWMGWIHWLVAVLFLMAAWGLGAGLSMFAIFLEEASFQRYPRLRQVFWLMFMSLVEQFGFRQMTVYWRIRGLVNHLRGYKGWGKMIRQGFEPATTPKPPAG